MGDASVTGVEACVLLMLVSVEFVIASEKVADSEELSARPVAPLAGDVVDTVGGVVSGAAAVVNCQGKLAASALPAASFEIGRASCRERVEISVVAGSFKK